MTATFTLSTCNCPEQLPQEPCIPDTVYITDSLLFAQLYGDFLFWRDSADNSKRRILDSLIDEAMAEVTEYRDKSIEQVEEMRGGFLVWMDSIKGLQIRGNMYINPSYGTQARVGFDSVTGKPYLKLD